MQYRTDKTLFFALSFSLVLTGVTLINVHSAFAEGEFIGPYVALSIGSDTSLSEASGDFSYDNLFAGGADGSAQSGTVKASRSFDFDAAGTLGAGYTIQLSDRVRFGVEGVFRLSGEEIIKENSLFSFPNPNNRADELRDLTVATTVDPGSQMSLSFQPGYLIRDDILVFGSVSYHYMNADVRSVTTFDSSILNTPSLTEAISEEDFHGIGIGIGGRYALNKNWSLFGRGEWIKFKSQKVSGPSLSTLDEITFSQDTDVAPSRASLMFGIVFSL